MSPSPNVCRSLLGLPRCSSWTSIDCRPGTMATRSRTTMTTTRYWLTAATRPARAAPSSGEMALKLRALGYHILELRAGDEIGAALGREGWEAVHCSPGCRERDHRNLKAPKPIRKATISVAD